MTTSFILAGVAIALGILSLGLPGGLLLTALKPLLTAIYRPGAEVYEDERMWPAAILLSALWPLTLPAGHAVATRLFGTERAYAAGFAGFALTGTVLLALGVLWSQRKTG